LASLKAERRLLEATSSLSAASAKLSSGLRINRPSDDAAGLAIASGLNVDARVYGQAARNVNDALGALNIAEGAVDQLSTIILRIRELAEQSANGVITTPQRSALDAEAQALRSEYNRITATASLNGLVFYGAGSTTINVQQGYGDGLDVTLGLSLQRFAGDGTFSAGPTQFDAGYRPGGVVAGDFNDDGLDDLIAGGVISSGTSRVLLSNGDGTFSFGNSLSSGGGSILGDINGDGTLDAITVVNYATNVRVSLGNGDGTFRRGFSFGTFNPTGYALLGDVTGDGRLDLLIGLGTASPEMLLFRGNGDGTFQSGVTSAASTGNSYLLALEDFDGDGAADVLVGDSGSNNSHILYNNGNGTFLAPALLGSTGVSTGGTTGDFNGDGRMDLAVTDHSNSRAKVFLNQGGRTFNSGTFYTMAGAARTVAAVDTNNDGFLDLVSAGNSGSTLGVALGNGNGTFRSPTLYGSVVGGLPLAVGDFNGDGVTDFGYSSYGARTFGIMFGNSNPVCQLENFSLRTQSGARDALDTMVEAMERVSNELSRIGTYASRLQTSYSAIRIGETVFKAAAAQIFDTDVAEQAAHVTRAQIVQQSAAAILGQANIQPALALKLIQG